MFSRFFVRRTVSRAAAFTRQTAKFSVAKVHAPKSLYLLGFALTVGVVGTVLSPPAHAAGRVDYKKVKEHIIKAIEDEDSRRGDGTSIAPTLVRLAWHAAGTYSIFDKTGGSNGASMRFSPESDWGANAGLKIARDFLEKIKKQHPAITYSDLWTLAGGTLILADVGDGVHCSVRQIVTNIVSQQHSPPNTP